MNTHVSFHVKYCVKKIIETGRLSKTSFSRATINSRFMRYFKSLTTWDVNNAEREYICLELDNVLINTIRSLHQDSRDCRTNFEWIVCELSIHSETTI